MKCKLIFFVLIFFNFAIFANEVNSFFGDFIEINNVFIKEPLYAKQQLISKNESSMEEKDAYSFFCGDSQLTFFDNCFFLGTNQGYWIMNDRMKMPLKVSGNYQVEEIEIQDILRIDFINDYEILNILDNEIWLQRKSKKAVYYFIAIKKEPKGKYRLIFQDKNKTNIKEAIYTEGIVNNLKCFSEIEIYNLTINTNKKLKYITKFVNKLNISQALFSHTQMGNLIDYIKNSGLLK